MMQPLPLDIENHAQLADYLRHRGSIGSGDADDMRAVTLAGGVSNKTVLVTLASGEQWVVKQALPKLRVQADWFSDPARIHREALGLHWYGKLAPAGAVPGLVFEDEPNHVLAMQAVPQPHENWKTMLLRGDVQLDHVRQFGALLGQCQRQAHERGVEIQPLFADRSFFESLRVEPYYRYTSSRVPASFEFYESLIADTLTNAQTLVHGDYSPKNVLVHHGQLVLLDYEVAHWGDPAFDVGFSMTHLLSKAHHVAAHRTVFAQAARLHWHTCAAEIGDLFGAVEQRAVRHTLGCLLARVDGRSPLEYLTEMERDRQRAAVLALMVRPPATMPDLIDRFVHALQSD
jgi:5-methylthioribose kinase